jgi:hypothetical protein
MGGAGSGPRHYYLRDTVDDCDILDASRWTREGILRQGVSSAAAWQWSNAATGEVRSSILYQVETTGTDHTVHLTYTFVKSGEQLNCAIRLETTRPHRGGVRWWFTCPVVVNGEPCGRRVQKLYLPPHQGSYFGCRHCYQLGYASRNQDAKMRAILKAQRIRRRLGGSPSLYEPFPEKPPEMWERTYRRLREQGLQAETRYWGPL